MYGKLTIFTIMGLWFGILNFPAAAQSGLTLASEVNIGFDCPVTAALDPEGMTLWVLMNGCFDGNYKLHTFDVVTGTRINDDDHNFSSALTALDDSWDYGMSLAVLPDGGISIFYSNADYQIQHLTIAAGSDGSVSATAEVSGEVSNFLINYTEYPETTVYNVDHTLALVAGADTVYVLDLEAQTEQLTIEIPGSPDNVFPSFSVDGQHVYVAQFNNYEDFDDLSSTLTVYSLSDGEVVATYDVPTAFLWMSVNEQYAVGLVGADDGTSEDIFLHDLAENITSERIPMYEPSRQLTACANDGRDMSDVDFTVSGHLRTSAVVWLPDSTGFFTLNSYGGERAGGGRLCIFNYSRLRQFTLEGG